MSVVPAQLRQKYGREVVLSCLGEACGFQTRQYLLEQTPCTYMVLCSRSAAGTASCLSPSWVNNCEERGSAAPHGRVVWIACSSTLIARDSISVPGRCRGIRSKPSLASRTIP